LVADKLSVPALEGLKAPTPAMSPTLIRAPGPITMLPRLDNVMLPPPIDAVVSANWIDWPLTSITPPATTLRLPLALTLTAPPGSAISVPIVT
jgi:hypothetical protein